MTCRNLKDPVVRLWLTIAQDGEEWMVFSDSMKMGRRQPVPNLQKSQDLPNMFLEFPDPLIIWLIPHMQNGSEWYMLCNMLICCIFYDRCSSFSYLRLLLLFADSTASWIPHWSSHRLCSSSPTRSWSMRRRARRWVKIRDSRDFLFSFRTHGCGSNVWRGCSLQICPLER